MRRGRWEGEEQAYDYVCFELGGDDGVSRYSVTGGEVGFAVCEDFAVEFAFALRGLDLFAAAVRQAHHAAGAGGVAFHVAGYAFLVE